jgi:anti-sigma B factor antagonist
MPLSRWPMSWRCETGKDLGSEGIGALSALSTAPAVRLVGVLVMGRSPADSGYGVRMADQCGLGPGREQLLSTSEGRLADAVVLTVAGEIDLFTAPRLRAALRDAFDHAGEGPVVLDLSQVTFLGSAGLLLLVDAVREEQKRPGPLRVVVDHARPVIRPLELTGLDDLLSLYHTVDQAMSR